MSEIETVKRIISEFFNREYKCEIVDYCIAEFIEELDRAVKDATKNYCFVEYASDKYIAIACGLFDTVHVELDYDIVEVVTVKPKVVKIKS